jgi:hypothetical protein
VYAPNFAVAADSLFDQRLWPLCEQVRNRLGLANKSVHEIPGVVANMSHLARFYSITVSNDVVSSGTHEVVYWMSYSPVKLI